MCDLTSSQGNGKIKIMGKNDIEKQLRKAILQSEMSQYRLAKLSGVSEGVISRFVRKERDIGLKTAAKLAATLKLKLIQYNQEGENYE
jgi:transcriptional regulator with XRE-family HTH domain